MTIFVKVGRLCNRKRPSLVPPVTTCCLVVLPPLLSAVVRSKPKSCLPYQFLKYQRTGGRAAALPINDKSTAQIQVQWILNEKGYAYTLLVFVLTPSTILTLYQKTSACLIFPCVRINQNMMQNRV
jgi:hypothetical protein